MNLKLMQKFSHLWNPWFSQNNNGGASSVDGTTELRTRILDLFAKYNIRSIFDSGSNDCNWIKELAPHVEYHGGDISVNMVNYARHYYSYLDIQLHDITSDPLPLVDCLFSRDVAIHLNNQDKKRMWQNWYNSGIPWILTTHILYCTENIDFEYQDNQFPESSVNWEIEPWNFPPPTDQIPDSGASHVMALWHRDQIKGLL